MKKYFSILGYFLARTWIKHEKHSLKRCPTWKKLLLTRLFITKQVSCCMVLKWLSNAISIMKNVFFSKTFDAEFMFRTAAVHLSCYENNFFEIDFWRQKVEKTIPFLNLKKNDEKIFFNFRLFSVAGMNNTRETLVKTISDVKKML
jgi:hypothetical protein